MTEITVECNPFKKGILTQKELNQFQKNLDENYELELKKEIQKIFKTGKTEINYDEIFYD